MAKILADNPEISPEMLDMQMKLNQAKKDLEPFEMLKAISDQSRLMNAYYYDPSTKPKLNFQEKLQSLSKPAKASIICMTLWTMFVIYRTADYHYVLGSGLERWDSDNFLMNWLAVPRTIAAIYFRSALGSC